MDELSLFQKWESLLDWILDRIEGFPKSVRFTFSEKMARISLEIMEAIIDCFYSHTKKQKLKHINIQLEQLRVYSRLCYKRRYFSISQYEFFSREINETGKIIGGWIKSCQE